METRRISPAAHNISRAAQNISPAAQNISMAAQDISRAAHDISMAAQNISMVAHDISVAAQNISTAAHDISLAAQKFSLAAHDISVEIKRAPPGAVEHPRYYRAILGASANSARASRDLSQSQTRQDSSSRKLNVRFCRAELLFGREKRTMSPCRFRSMNDGR